MTPGDWAEEIRDEEVDTDDADHRQVPKTATATDKSRPTVAITHSVCDSCGAANVQPYHDACSAPIIYVGSEWQCAGCGSPVSPADTCPGCGASIAPDTLEVPLDISHRANPNELERAVHEETNRRRSQHNLDTLAYSDHLSAIALQHSRDMAHREFFDHTSPDGEDASDRYRRFGHDTRSCGENIARTHPSPDDATRDVAASVVDDWMDSPGHRENILREQFEREGIGVYLTTQGAVYSTQNFY